MKRPVKKAKKSAKKSSVKQIDDVVGNVTDQLIVAPISDALKAGATIRRKAK